ncbi:hypothetical protein CPB86DRAFT_102093 [Serendipita vermifera]|nr:hypothetical protein CPB86DRAFT_102093 [Serendipita vermifera]
MSKTRYLLGIYLKRLVTTGEPIIGPARLPTELLIKVVECVDGAKELCRLCRVSKLLRTIAEPILYQLCFSHSRFAQSDIRTLLAHPRFEAMINFLCIEFVPWIYCSKWDNGRAYFHSNRRCSCDELDKSLGVALNGLLNLEVFQFRCSLCPPKTYERHRFFATLQTRVLRKVNFTCRCSWMDEMTVMESFRAPCMTSVVTLGWHTDTPTSGALLEFRPGEKVLPKLQHLHYLKKDPTLLFIRYDSITQLCAWPLGRGLLKLEYQNQPTQIGSKNGQSSLNYSLRAAPGEFFSFRNLRHIGVFFFTSPTTSELCDNFHTKLKPFGHLKGIVSIDAGNYNPVWAPGNEYIPSFQHTLNNLSRVFPNLRRVHLRNPQHLMDIWELSGSWRYVVQRCKVDQFDLLLDLIN